MGKAFKVADEQADIARASLRYLWKMCHDHINAGGSTAAATPTVASQTSPTQRTMPKEIPADEMKKLIDAYENQQIHGQKRTFPLRQLIGAEKVVARAWWEHQQKTYTPMQLHELLVHRFFDATGQINPLNQAASTQSKGSPTVTFDLNSQAVKMTSDEQNWSPKGIISLMDALEAVQWCWVLIQLSHELEVVEYVSWWKRTFRSHANRIEQLKLLWLDMGWRIALEMRQGRSFGSITQEVMNDQAALQTALLRELPAAPKMKPQPPAKNHGGKGSGGSKPAASRPWNSQKRPTWDSQPGWSPQKEWKGDQAKWPKPPPNSGGTGAAP